MTRQASTWTTSSTTQRSERSTSSQVRLPSRSVSVPLTHSTSRTSHDRASTCLATSTASRATDQAFPCLRKQSSYLLHLPARLPPPPVQRTWRLLGLNIFQILQSAC